MNKLILGLKSPGNWMLLLSGGLGILQQARPCLTGKSALVVDSVLGLVAVGGAVWNTLHLNAALMSQPPQA